MLNSRPCRGFSGVLGIFPKSPRYPKGTPPPHPPLQHHTDADRSEVPTPPPCVAKEVTHSGAWFTHTCTDNRAVRVWEGVYVEALRRYPKKPSVDPSQSPPSRAYVTVVLRYAAEQGRVLFSSALGGIPAGQSFEERKERVTPPRPHKGEVGGAALLLLRSPVRLATPFP